MCYLWIHLLVVPSKTADSPKLKTIKEVTTTRKMEKEEAAFNPNDSYQLLFLLTFGSLPY